MKLIQSYKHPNERERGNKVHIFQQTTNKGFKTLCKCYPKGSYPYEGDISDVTCHECKSIYSGEFVK
jgi:hypothetical protein